MTSPRAASPTASSKSERPRLVLASESPRRLNLLRQAGIVPDAVQPADIDETQKRGEPPRKYVERLAAEKARAVTVSENTIVLAADTTVVCGRQLLHKPETPDAVRRYIAMLSGRRHQVLTGIAAIRDGKLRTRIVPTRISFSRI